MARRETLLDLQFRGVEGKDAKATLYLGLTALMGIRAKRGASGPARFRLVPHAGKEAGADGDPALLKLSTRMLELSKWLPIDNLAGSWADVEAYLNRLIPRIKERWTGVEGAVQSTLEVTRSVAVIDREVVLGYKNDSTRKSIKGSVTKRYNEALREPPSAEDAPWWKGKHPFGNELDLLCVDGNGRLLLIELKPASATAGIAWSPAQVSVYRDLFLRWVAQEEEEKARDTLRRMLEQRMGLGLLPRRSGRGKKWTIDEHLRIVPVVGIGGEVRSREALPRLLKVQRRLVERGLACPELEVWSFGTVDRRLWHEWAATPGTG